MTEDAFRVSLHQRLHQILHRRQASVGGHWQVLAGLQCGAILRPRHKVGRGKKIGGHCPLLTTTASSHLVAGARYTAEKKTPSRIIGFDFERRRVRIAAETPAALPVTCLVA